MNPVYPCRFCFSIAAWGQIPRAHDDQLPFIQTSLDPSISIQESIPESIPESIHIHPLSFPESFPESFLLIFLDSSPSRGIRQGPEPSRSRHSDFLAAAANTSRLLSVSCSRGHGSVRHVHPAMRKRFQSCMFCQSMSGFNSKMQQD